MAAASTAISEKSHRRNITVSLSEETIRKAKILAAKQDTSVSGLLTQKIEEMVSKDDEYEQAKVGALARLRSGFTFGKIEHMTREEIHDRKAAREVAANHDE